MEDGDASKTIEVLDPELTKTELCYTTSLNKKVRSFFGQLCKFSDEELKEFNEAVDKYCIQVKKRNDGAKTGKVELGDVVGSNYLGTWYRARVVDFKKKGTICRVRFIDYGNLADANPADLVYFNKKEIPIVERRSFGITYNVDFAKDCSEEEFEKLANCLQSDYVMLKILNRDANNAIYDVKIPRHGYNRDIWRSLDGEEPEDISDGSSSSESTG